MTAASRTNEYFPLPANYGELTVSEQRAARVATASLTGSPENEVLGWSFFRDYYLQADPAVGFDPGFYAGRYLESPPLHYKIAHWRYEQELTALAAPRGSAKSTTVDSICLRDLVVKPGYRVATFKATDGMVVKLFDRLKFQIQENSRLLEDFGRLEPTRGRGLWSLHAMRLTNNAAIDGFSIDGRKRGVRPDLVILDDVEDDKSSRTRSESRLRELRETTLKVILPMLDTDCHLLYIFTLLSRRSFGYYVLTNPDSDPRFRSVEQGGDWQTVLVPARDSAGRNAWQAKFTDEFLQKKRRQMGDSFFRTEYLNDPVSEQDAVLRISPLENEYTLEEGVGDSVQSPFTCEAEVTYQEVTRQGATERTPRWNKFLEGLYRIITVDYAPGQSLGSDFTAVLVLGLDACNDLFVLDAWQQRMPAARVAALVWGWALKWRVSVIAGEAVAIQLELMNKLRELGPDFERQYGYCPRIYPVKYPGNLSKEDRIAGLEPRFLNGKIKLPGHRQFEDTMRDLYSQIAGFTMDLSNLPHDDLVDALAQSQWVFRGGRPVKTDQPRPQTPVELLKQGETYAEGTTIPLSTFINWHDLTQADLEHILTVQRGVQQDRIQGEAADQAEPELIVQLGDAA